MMICFSLISRTLLFGAVHGIISGTKMNDPKIIELKKIYDFYNFLSNNTISKTLDEFKHKLHFENRFFNDNHSIFSCIKKSFGDHTIQLTKGELLYRARKIENEDGCKFCKDGYFEEGFYAYNKRDSYVPPLKIIKANRANTEGIPCLYAAKEEKTAIAEVRPFLGNEISVAGIQIKRDLTIFDLYLDLNIKDIEIIKLSSPDIWLGIAFAFSIPYENTSKNEYLLTQCVSEYVQLSGFDGIRYSSSLDENGKNIVLFNCKHIDDGGNYDIFEPISSHICIVNNIKHLYGFIN